MATPSPPGARTTGGEGDVMPTLPARPHLDQLRRQAKELLCAARAADSSALNRLRVVSDRADLASAQLAIAREYGFASWARLTAEVDARTIALAEQVDAFCRASIRDGSGRAVHMLAANPQIATYNLATAVILGDVDRVRRAVERDPGVAITPDPRTGWTPIHAVCASWWYRFDADRRPGLLAVARLLLDSGADPNTEAAGRRGGWTPQRCAVAGAANPEIVRLLLDRGARPSDHDVYLSCFGDDDRRSLRLLLDSTPNLANSTALAAPISTGDTDAIRMMLDAGVDATRPMPAELFGEGYDDELWPTIYAAVRSGSTVDLVELLLSRGASPSAPGPDDRSPHQIAVSQGRTELAGLLLSYGAVDDATGADRFLSACRRADRSEALRLLAADPHIVASLGARAGDAIVAAAEAGNTPSVGLMIELGIPINVHGGEVGATPLHAAAYAGAADTVRHLIEAGADLEAHDGQWDDTPLGWAKVGSGHRHTEAPNPDWLATVRMLVDAGASLVGIALSDDDPKPPSAAVAELLRGYGVPDA